MNDDLNTSAAMAVLFELARPLKSIANEIERNPYKQIPDIKAKKINTQGGLLSLNLRMFLAFKEK